MKHTEGADSVAKESLMCQHGENSQHAEEEKRFYMEEGEHSNM